MPFPMKIQPIDSQAYEESIQFDTTAKPVIRSRFKRLFDRPFPSVLRISVAEKPNACEALYGKDAGTEFDPSTLCLAKMVQSFMEESNDKQSSVKCNRNRCNCFHGGINDSGDDEFDITSDLCDSISASSFGEFCDSLKGLIPCTSVAERNLLADTSKIVEKNKNCKRKDDLRTIVTDSLLALGYNASVCKSRWEKSPYYPAGEYEYIDVIVEGDRFLIDVDFRSEFEIARSTGNYKTILQLLPNIFVGQADRLNQIISIVSEAAKQSLKKKGMPIPPWRKVEYVRAKWLSPHTRTTPPPMEETGSHENENKQSSDSGDFGGEFELIFGDITLSETTNESGLSSLVSTPEITPGNGVDSRSISSPWFPPAIKPKSCQRGTKVVTGLASLFMDKA